MRILIHIFLIFFLISCTTKEEKIVSSENLQSNLNSNLEAEPVSMDQKNANGNIEFAPQLIKEASINFETKDPKISLQKIKHLIKKYNAIISNENQYSDGANISNQINIKINSKDFEKFLDELEQNIENIDSKTVNVQDVSEEYYDLQTRIKTKKEIEDRYISILKQAKTIKDIIEVENQIGIIRTEIESMEGRIKYLQNRVSYSAISINYHTPIIKKDTWEFNFTEAIKSGWIVLLKFIKVLITIWPLLLILSIGYIVYKKRNLKRNN